MKRSKKEIMGRIRLVNEGHLQQLAEELFRDAQLFYDQRQQEKEAQRRASMADGRRPTD